jgi:hypothetical protein
MVPESGLPDFPQVRFAGLNLLTIETRFGNALLLPVGRESRCYVFDETDQVKRLRNSLGNPRLVPNRE